MLSYAVLCFSSVQCHPAKSRTIKSSSMSALTTSSPRSTGNYRISKPNATCSKPSVRPFSRISLPTTTTYLPFKGRLRNCNQRGTRSGSKLGMGRIKMLFGQITIDRAPLLPLPMLAEVELVNTIMLGKRIEKSGYWNNVFSK